MPGAFENPLVASLVIALAMARLFCYCYYYEKLNVINNYIGRDLLILKTNRQPASLSKAKRFGLPREVAFMSRSEMCGYKPPHHRFPNSLFFFLSPTKTTEQGQNNNGTPAGNKQNHKKNRRQRRKRIQESLTSLLLFAMVVAAGSLVRTSLSG